MEKNKMNLSRKTKYTFIIPFIFCLLWLTGCGGGGAPVRYYLVDPMTSSAAAFQPQKPPVIEIMDLRIPQYLERFQIVTRSGESRLRFSDSHQWGDNLRKNLMRTMAMNLSILLATDDIGTPLIPSSSQPDHRLQIHILRYERDTNGMVRLQARWQLIDADGTGKGMYSVRLESDQYVAENNYDEIVRAMQDLFGELSRSIADTIIKSLTGDGKADEN